MYDSHAIRRFIGIDLAREAAPDATTLLKFRRLLEDQGLTGVIFETINAHLAEQGLLLREGTLVDATLIAAPPSTKNRDRARAGGALLPVSSGDVSVTCPCGDGAVCRHAAAVHVALAERFDRDPFLLLLLRGKGRDEILARLRDARSRRTMPAPVAPRRAETAVAVPLEPLPEVRPEAFFRPLVPLSTLKTRFVPPEHPEALLTRLGHPPLQDDDAARLLVDMHRAIGRSAADRLTEAEWRRVTPRGRASGE